MKTEVKSKAKAAPKMDTLRACLICEGNEDASEEETQAAWQFLYDQRADRWLQGFYGRSMRGMLASGYITNKGAAS